MLWWNLEQKSMMLAELPSLNLEIAANPAAVGTDSEVTAASSKSGWIAPAIVVTLGLLVFAFVRTRFEVLRALIRRWHAARHSREIAYFRRVLRAARAGDHRATLAALMAWLDRRASHGDVGSLEAFMSTVGIPELTEQVRVLESHVCVTGAAASSPWSPEVFCRQIRAVRRRLDHARRLNKRGHVLVLPPLNP